MTNEVETVKDETDWAMDYAAENRRRVKAERRLAAMAHVMGCMLASAHKIVDISTEPGKTLEPCHMQAMVKALINLSKSSFDCEIMANLLTADPPWGISPEVFDLLIMDIDKRSPAESRQLDRHFEEFERFLESCWEEAIKEWKMICQEHDLRPMEDVEAERKADVMMKIIMKSIADKEILDCITENADGQEQEAKAH